MKLAPWATFTDIFGVAYLVFAWATAMVVIAWWALEIEPWFLLLEPMMAVCLVLAIILACQLVEKSK